MRKRRFSLTAEQGEITLISLENYINTLEKVIQEEIKEDTKQYLTALLIRARVLKFKLENYQWEVNEK